MRLMTALAVSTALMMTSPAFAKNYTMLKVDGEEISYDEVQDIWDALFPGEEAAPPIDQFGDAIKGNVVRGIVSERLMLKDAEAGKLQERRDVMKKIAAARRQVLVQEHLRVRTVNTPEATIKKRYDEMVSKIKGGQQAHASHILVEVEEEAKEIKTLLDEGADFALTAKRRSVDVGSSGGGGDLGFFNKEQMVKEFADAAFTLEKDQISEPVKSSFGWHIIKLHEKRDVPLPPYEEARLTIEEQMRQEANQQYIKDLLKGADIDYRDAKGKTLEFPIEIQEK
ncbi:MAG: peptidylprolyl isomerase [Rickettsiales bacterium]|nr:peptidylprolyl isomerase [Rickettsiales bacterium]